MTFYLSLLSTLLLLTGITFFGWRKPAYSHWQHTISELAEVGSPLSSQVSYGLFLPVGLLLALYLGGSVEYIGSAYWLTRFSTQPNGTDNNLYSIAAASLVVGSILLSIPGLPVRGLVQRLMEGILLGSLLLAE